MDDATALALIKRLDRIEKQAMQFAVGEVTALSPLSVKVSGASTAFTGVKTITPVAVGDIVSVVRWGNDLLVLGKAGTAIVPTARAYNSANFSHNSSGNWLAITLDSERFDTDTIHSTSSNTSRLTATTAGVYVVSGCIEWDNSALGTLRGIGVRLGGSTFIAKAIQGPSSNGLVQAITSQPKLTAGQYLELVAYQDSGGTRTITAAGDYSPEFSMTRVAAGT